MLTIALHSTLNISETVRDRGLVPKDQKYGVSYGHVTDDVTWPYDTPYAISYFWWWRHVTLKSQTRDPQYALFSINGYYRIRFG